MNKNIWMLIFCAVIFLGVSTWIFVMFPDDALDLLFFFTYITIACTVFPLPTHGIVMDYGDGYGTALIAILGGIGTSTFALIDYILLTFVFRHTKIGDRIRETWTYRHTERLFQRNGFITIVFISFMPLPLELVKVLGCMTKYSMIKFLVAIFLGRAPRYYFLGELQGLLRISRWCLYGSIPVLVAIEASIKLLKRSRSRKSKASQSRAGRVVVKRCIETKRGI